ncbi:MAG: DUF1294 domain-containing protein [Ruminococcaceae bacterium]|jgi:uncharacterized membrane protein YsdA (DUF1294 family)|nr:DUF1294 domain-containing protein [Oscillospiraceae bacterium]
MSVLQKFLLIYFCVISMAAVIVTIHDKRAAIRHRRRVPERTLLLLSTLGGSAAMYLTMQCIRHKTKHAKFMVRIPVIILLQVLLGLLWYFHFV